MYNYIKDRDVQVMRKLTLRVFATGFIIFALFLSGCNTLEHGTYTKEAAAKVNESKEKMDAASAYEKSMQLFAIGNLSEALDQVDASIKLSDDVVATHLLHLQICIDMDKDNDTIGSMVETCMKRWPEEARFIYYHGVYYERQGKIDKALKCYLNAAKIDNNSIQYKMAVAEMYLESGATHDAKEYLLNACSIHPNAPGLLQNLGYLEQMEKDNLKAKEYFLAAYSLAPDESALQENLACVYYDLGEYENALPIFIKLLELKSYADRNDLKYMAIRSSIRCHKPVEAKNLITMLLKSPDCNQEIAWKEMLNVSLMLDDMLLCEKSVKQLQKIDKNSEVAILAAAVLQHKKGHINSARAILQQYTGNKSEIFEHYQSSLALQ